MDLLLYFYSNDSSVVVFLFERCIRFIYLFERCIRCANSLRRTSSEVECTSDEVRSNKGSSEVWFFILRTTFVRSFYFPPNKSYSNNFRPKLRTFDPLLEKNSSEVSRYYRIYYSDTDENSRPKFQLRMKKSLIRS